MLASTFLALHAERHFLVMVIEGSIKRLAVLHPGGVNLLLGDGSARFVNDSIALNVWRAVCTPAAWPNEKYC